MLFSSNPNQPVNSILCNLKIGNNNIVQVADTNFLGVTISHDLKWEKHINKINLKISSGIYALNKTKHQLTKQHSLQIYNSLILPHITYGITLWGNTYKKDTHKLTIKQKKAVRHINNAPYNAHSSPLFKHSNILQIPDLYSVNLLKLMHRIINLSAPAEVLKLFPTINNPHSQSTRHQNYRLPSIKKAICHSSFLFQGPKLLTSLPSTLKANIASGNIHKQYKSHLISQY